MTTLNDKCIIKKSKIQQIKRLSDLPTRLFNDGDRTLGSHKLLLI